MSLRTFFRAFSEATGTTPADWVEMTRLERARRLLEQTEADVKVVAAQSGFMNDERMRRVFVKRVGVSPAAYRARFRRDGAHDPRTAVSLLAVSQRHGVSISTRAVLRQAWRGHGETVVRWIGAMLQAVGAGRPAPSSVRAEAGAFPEGAH